MPTNPVTDAMRRARLAERGEAVTISDAPPALQDRAGDVPLDGSSETSRVLQAA